MRISRTSIKPLAITNPPREAIHSSRSHWLDRFAASSASSPCPLSQLLLLTFLLLSRSNLWVDSTTLSPWHTSSKSSSSSPTPSTSLSVIRPRISPPFPASSPVFSLFAMRYCKVEKDAEAEDDFKHKDRDPERQFYANTDQPPTTGPIVVIIVVWHLSKIGIRIWQINKGVAAVIYRYENFRKFPRWQLEDIR